MLTPRERLIMTLSHKAVDRVPDLEFGAWPQTIERWVEEGLPKKFVQKEYQSAGMWKVIPEFFHTDDHLDSGINLGIAGLLCPEFEKKILEKKGNHLIIQDEEGVIYEMLAPELGASIPKYLRFPIENRQDWVKFRDSHLDPDAPGRLDDNINEMLQESCDCTGPVSIFCTSLYGKIRNYMGVENLSYAIYDEPDWVEEMMEHMTWLTLSVLGKIAGKCKIDIAMWWEDMCYRNGPLLSPAHFEQWMVPRYRRITDFLKNEFSCCHNMLDSDGNIHALTDLWLEGGINCMFPIESAHTDVYKIYHRYGDKVGLRGAFDKRALIAGKEAIDKEFDRLMPLIDKKCLIVHTDHLVPPDVSFADYCYYRERKVKLIGK